MSVPTTGDEFAKLIEHLRKVQEGCAMMSHLVGAQGSAKDKLLAQGWLAISELMKMVQHKVIELAQGRLQ